MKAYYVLLAVVIALAGSTTSATASESPLSKMAIENSEIVTAGRMLRAETSDEERGVFSNIGSSITNKLKMNEAKKYAKAEKTDDYVRAKFGLGDATGAALKAKENYKYYEAYLAKLTSIKMDVWVRQGQSTSQRWRGYGLAKMDDALRKDSEAYKSYATFLQNYDDAALRYYKRFKEIPTNMRFDGSKAEKLAKVDIWATQGRPAWYVKALLKQGGQELDNMPYYQKYLETVKALGKTT